MRQVPSRAFESLAIFLMGLALLLSACTGQGAPPVQAQLATACNSIAAGYNIAAGYKAQGKLSPSQVATLHDLEPAVESVCNKTNPPTDLGSALTAASAALSQITLINAGVHK